MDIKKGSVVKINNKDLVVINTDKLMEFNRYDEALSAHIFTTVSREDFENGKENPKEKTWTLKDISTMHGPNEVLSKNIEIVDQVQILAQVTKVYRPKI